MHALLATASGDPREAIARSRELLRHAPEHPLAHRLIGASQVERGRLVDADNAFTDAVRLDPSDHETAEAAREVRMLRHWLLWPLRPAMRIGNGPLWVGAVVTMLALRALQLHTALLWFTGAWVAYCVYSWIAPPAVRWLLRPR